MPDSEKEFLYGPDEEAENTSRASYPYQFILELFPAFKQTLLQVQRMHDK